MPPPAGAAQRGNSRLVSAAVAGRRTEGRTDGRTDGGPDARSRGCCGGSTGGSPRGRTTDRPTGALCPSASQQPARQPGSPRAFDAALGNRLPRIRQPVSLSFGPKALSLSLSMFRPFFSCTTRPPGGAALLFHLLLLLLPFLLPRSVGLVLSGTLGSTLAKETSTNFGREGKQPLLLLLLLSFRRHKRRLLLISANSYIVQRLITTSA
jgi:hypothetical protein